MDTLKYIVLGFVVVIPLFITVMGLGEYEVKTPIQSREDLYYQCVRVAIVQQGKSINDCVKIK